jgi:hypothetical protein
LEFKSDAGAMLFNLTTHTSFPCIDPSYAIGCKKDIGPYFGSLELSAYYEPFNKENACKSYTNDRSYKIPHNSEGINMLTNQKCNGVLSEGTWLSNFTISEIEVWGVSFNE